MKKFYFLTILFAMLPFLGYADSKAVLVPEANGNLHYQFRFDDIVLGEHENGTNNQWNDGNPTGSDHRARNFTMSAWVKAVSSQGSVMGHGQKMFYGAEGTMGVWINNGKLNLKSRSWEDGGSCPGNVNKNTDATLEIGEWAFITVVVDDANMTIKLYKNGILVASETMNNHGIGMLSDECVFYVGNDDFACYVDEVQVWTKALTDEEVMTSLRGGYTSENVPAELVAYYKIESDSQAELGNKGSYQATSCTAGVVEGTEAYSQQYWGNVYTCDFIEAEIVEGHTFGMCDITITQPTEGGSFKVYIGEEEFQGGSVDEGTTLTVVTEAADGYYAQAILVNGAAIEGNTFVATGSEMEVTVNFAIGTAIEEVKETAISCYYAAGTLYINGVENAEIAIYDITGKQVKVAHEAPVKVADLAKGCYIATVNGKALKFIKK